MARTKAGESTPTIKRRVHGDTEAFEAMGDKLRKAREAKKLSQSDVAKAAKTTQSSIASYERGLTYLSEDRFEEILAAIERTPMRKRSTIMGRPKSGLVYENIYCHFGDPLQIDLVREQLSPAEAGAALVEAAKAKLGRMGHLP